MHFGYLDPTTGSLFVQAIIGMFVGTAFFFRKYFYKLRSKVFSIFKRSPSKLETKPSKD
jgi:hypothetical protein